MSTLNDAEMMRAVWTGKTLFTTRGLDFTNSINPATTPPSSGYHLPAGTQVIVQAYTSTRKQGTVEAVNRKGMYALVSPADLSLVSPSNSQTPAAQVTAGTLPPPASWQPPPWAVTPTLQDLIQCLYGNQAIYVADILGMDDAVGLVMPTRSIFLPLGEPIRIVRVGTASSNFTDAEVESVNNPGFFKLIDRLDYLSLVPPTANTSFTPPPPATQTPPPAPPQPDPTCTACQALKAKNKACWRHKDGPQF